MREVHSRRGVRYVMAVLLLAAVTLLSGGCPIDTNDLITDVAAAALTSMADSLVDSLSGALP